MNDTTSPSVSGQGLLMIVLGLFLILRSVTKSSAGNTLIDKLLGKSTSTTAAAGGTASQKRLRRPRGSDDDESPQNKAKPKSSDSSDDDNGDGELKMPEGTPSESPLGDIEGDFPVL